MTRPAVSVLMTCHNRRALTVGAIAAISVAAVTAEVDVRVFLVDDGSTDGTATAVAAAYPDVRLIRGDGNLYWNGGMRLAWQTALTEPADFFLWLNDDLAVYPDSLANALACFAQHRRAFDDKVIIVGRTSDPRSGQISYGGYARAPGVSRLRYRRLRSDELFCYTMEGNFVLFPAVAAGHIGINDGSFRHSFGDVDYGLRAGRAGFGIVQLDKDVGEQERNDHFDRATARMTRQNYRAMLTHPKLVPWREWWLFCRRHGGPLGPVNFGLRYAKMILRGVRTHHG